MHCVKVPVLHFATYMSASWIRPGLSRPRPLRTTFLNLLVFHRFLAGDEATRPRCLVASRRLTCLRIEDSPTRCSRTSCTRGFVSKMNSRYRCSILHVSEVNTYSEVARDPQPLFPNQHDHDHSPDLRQLSFHRIGMLLSSSSAKACASSVKAAQSASSGDWANGTSSRHPQRRPGLLAHRFLSDPS